MPQCKEAYWHKSGDMHYCVLPEGHDTKHADADGQWNSAEELKTSGDDVEFTDDGPIRSSDEAAHQEEQLGFRVDAFLRSKGWKHTSSTPGCLWLWERTLPDSRVALCDTSMALAIQRGLES